MTEEAPKAALDPEQHMQAKHTRTYTTHTFVAAHKCMYMKTHKREQIKRISQLKQQKHSTASLLVGTGVVNGQTKACRSAVKKIFLYMQMYMLDAF